MITDSVIPNGASPYACNNKPGTRTYLTLILQVQEDVTSARPPPHAPFLPQDLPKQAVNHTNYRTLQKKKSRNKQRVIIVIKWSIIKCTCN